MNKELKIRLEEVIQEEKEEKEREENLELARIKKEEEKVERNLKLRLFGHTKIYDAKAKIDTGRTSDRNLLRLTR